LTIPTDEGNEELVDENKIPRLVTQGTQTDGRWWKICKGRCLSQLL